MTIGCLMGFVGRDPEVEYWDASKINSMKRLDGTNATTHGEGVETWHSCNSKRSILRNTRLASQHTLSTNTAWRAIRVWYTPPANPGTRTLMTKSNYIVCQESVTFFYVFRNLAYSLVLGYLNFEPTTQNNSNTQKECEMVASTINLAIRINGVARSLVTGNIGTVYPTLAVYGFRVFQNGTGVTVWAIGPNAVVQVLTVANYTWVPNPLTFMDMFGCLNMYYIEINRDIKTTAQMLARRNELFNRYA